LYNLKLP